MWQEEAGSACRVVFNTSYPEFLFFVCDSLWSPAGTAACPLTKARFCVALSATPCAGLSVSCRGGRNAKVACCANRALTPACLRPSWKARRHAFCAGCPPHPDPIFLNLLIHEKKFVAGVSFQFDLTLIGQAAELYPYAIYAVDRMAQTGLGARRHPFALQEVAWQKNGSGAETLPRVEDGWQPLYDGTTKRLIAEPKPRVTPDPSIENGNGSLQLEFLTPTRLKFKNELTMDWYASLNAAARAAEKSRCAIAGEPGQNVVRAAFRANPASPRGKHITGAHETRSRKTSSQVDPVGGI